MTAEQTVFSEWAILELMGHRRLAGLVSEASIGGAALIRIDIPAAEGPGVTQFYNSSAVYCLTPTTEEIARQVAVGSRPAPVQRWELSSGSDDDDDGPLD